MIDPDLDALVAEPGELGHAIVDLSTTGPLKISIVSVPESADAAALTAGLSLLANSGLHVRGTFPLANRMLLTRHGSGLGRLRLGDDQSYDPDLIGTNYVDGGSVTLSGNFGVLYDVRVVDPTNDLALAINPRAGAWAGAMLGTAGQDQSGGALALPSGAGSLSSNDDVVSLGRYTSGISIGTKLLTAGGSSLPVHFVLAPL